MKEIGSFLKETRMQNGVSLEEASSDLNITKDELENLEEGNFKAFRDVYDLKIIVREYSKYLGVNPDKALDEFNDFMFEHTSKWKKNLRLYHHIQKYQKRSFHL